MEVEKMSKEIKDTQAVDITSRYLENIKMIVSRNEKEKRKENISFKKKSSRSLKSEVLEVLRKNKETVRDLIFSAQELCDILQENGYMSVKNKQYTIQRDISNLGIEDIHIHGNKEQSYFTISFD